MAAVGGNESMEDLLGHLTKTAAELRRSEVDLRVTTGPRIPRAEDCFGATATWRPPPDKEEIKRHVAETTGNTWVRFVKNAGSEFHANPGYLKSKPLEVLEASRAMMPDRSFAKLPSQIRYRQHTEEFTPEDALCTESHQHWLKRHRDRRDRHVHNIYHALQVRDKAKEKYDVHARQRELTRDLLTRGTIEDGPKLSTKVKTGLAKVLTSVGTGRILNKMAGGTDKLVALEVKDKAAYERAKSVPCLQVRPPLPSGSVHHLRAWAGNSHALRCFNTSTPWIEQDEIRELQAKGMLSKSIR